MKALHRIAYVYTYLMRQGDLSSTFKSELDAMIGDMEYKPWSDDEGAIYVFLEKLGSLCEIFRPNDNLLKVVFQAELGLPFTPPPNGALTTKNMIKTINENPQNSSFIK